MDLTTFLRGALILEFVSLADASGSLRSNGARMSAQGRCSNLLEVDSPTITALLPTSIQSSAGVIVTILGSNLAVFPNDDARISVGGLVCEPRRSPKAAPEKLLCDLTATPDSSFPSCSQASVCVRINGRQASSQLLAWAAPGIQSARPPNAPTAGGTTITLVGSAFGASQEVFARLGTLAAVGDTACTSTRWLSASQVACTVPAGLQSSSLNVSVTCEASSACPSAPLFTYDAPFITHAWPKILTPSAAMTLTMNGLNLGDSSFSMQSTRVSVGSKPCEVVALTQTQLVCNIPDRGDLVGAGILLSVGSQTWRSRADLLTVARQASMTSPSTSWLRTLAGMEQQMGLIDARGELARFGRPTNIVIDEPRCAACPETVLYGSDSDNHAIRSVGCSTAEVRTLVSGQAGYSDGSGASARFNRPIGIALDASGRRLFVADQGNFRIRRITRFLPTARQPESR